jgi:hypothetical protein
LKEKKKKNDTINQKTSKFYLFIKSQHYIKKEKNKKNFNTILDIRARENMEEYNNYMMKKKLEKLKKEEK